MIDTLYQKGHTVFHLFDCRIKLFLLPWLLLYFFIPMSLEAAVIYSLFYMIIIAASLGPGDLWLPLKMILPLLILVTLLTPLFHREGAVLLRLDTVILLTTAGVEETLRYILRFSGISLLFFLFFRTTAMDDILLGLSWYRLPYTLTLVISIALRYIPHLAGLYGQIRAAHALRCSINDVEPRRRIFGGIHAKVGTLFPVLVSLVIQSVKTIPLLSMALELKGIGRSNGRTQSRSLTTPDKIYGQIFYSLTLLVIMITPLILFR